MKWWLKAWILKSNCQQSFPLAQSGGMCAYIQRVQRNKELRRLKSQFLCNGEGLEEINLAWHKGWKQGETGSSSKLWDIEMVPNPPTYLFKPGTKLRNLRKSHRMDSHLIETRTVQTTVIVLFDGCKVPFNSSLHYCTIQKHKTYQNGY